MSHPCTSNQPNPTRTRVAHRFRSRLKLLTAVLLRAPNPHSRQALNALEPAEREQMMQMLGLTPMPVATPAPAPSDTGAMDVETPAAAPTPAAPPPIRPAEVSTPEGTAEGEEDQTEPVKMEEDPAEEASKPDDGSA